MRTPTIFRRDSKTGEEIAHRVTTPEGRTFVTATNAQFWEDTPGHTVEEVRGRTHPRGIGFVVDRPAPPKSEDADCE